MGDREKDKGDKGNGQDKEKGKQVMSLDEDYYYSGRAKMILMHSMMHLIKITREELPGVNESEPEASFEEWEEEFPSWMLSLMKSSRNNN